LPLKEKAFVAAAIDYRVLREKEEEERIERESKIGR
jgi:hypothetical protein